MNKFFVFLCAMLLSFGIARIVNAECSINLESGNIAVSVFGDGDPNIQETVGQTFKLPDACTALESFTFFVDDILFFDNPEPPILPLWTFKAYVMEWNEDSGIAEGSILYESDPRVTTDQTSFETFEFDVGVELSSSKVYVAFISVSEGGVNYPGTFKVDTNSNNPYSDGKFVFHNSGVDSDFPSTLIGSAWTSTTLPEFPQWELSDMAFNMTFSTSIEALVSAVMNLNLQSGISNSLDAKLDSALNAIDDINANNDVAAINSLEAFINAVEAQRGNKITNEQANTLIAAAQAIIDILNSP